MTSVSSIAEPLESLRQCWRENRLAHAYLVRGQPKGAGLAFALAAADWVLSEGGADAGRLSKRVQDRTHPDLLIIEPEKKSRIIGMEKVREINHWVSQTSYEGGWKVIVILDADRLGGKDGAPNALLKTLEEPPPRRLFLLVTLAPDDVLPTIRSRCQHIHLSAAEVDDQAEWRPALLSLLRTDILQFTAEGLAAADRLAGLLEKEKKALEAAEQERSEGEDEDVRKARAEARYRELRMAFLQCMQSWYRDVLFCAQAVGPELLARPNEQPALQEQARRLGSRGALRALRAVEGMPALFVGNLSDQTVLTLALLQAAGE